jgi:hypothetical protein
MDKDLAQKLRQETAGCRLQLQKWGISKALTQGQVIKAAEEFHSDAKFLRASKKLIDTGHPAWKKVIEIRSRMTAAWKSTTLPYPEPGIRLIRKIHVAGFNAKMSGLRTEFDEAVKDLQERYAELRESARHDLGDLFNEHDYPTQIDELFDVHWDYPNLEPPNYLKEINPELYEEQKKRIEARLEEAVAMTEAALAEEMNKLITHMIDRLTGGEDGKPKQFKDQTVENLREFFDGFKAANIGSNAQLDALMEQAKGVIGSRTPGEMRTDAQIRDQIKEGLQSVATQLDALMVAKPRRKIVLEEETPAPEETGELVASG